MADLVQYVLARVKTPLANPDEYDVWALNQRPPRVGDIGVFIDILQGPGVPDRFVVEMSEPDTGETIWLSDFEKVELEPVAEESASN